MSGDRQLCCRHPSNQVDQPLCTLWDTPVQRPPSLLGWFDNQIARLQEDLFRHRFFDMPEVARVAFDPQRRSRLFDALFATDECSFAASPRFTHNPTRNQLECQLNTGCGDFFRPEDVEVNVNGRVVEFKARREDRSDDGNSYAVREVRRMLTVPEEADAEQLQAEMGLNGKLMITAPLLKPALEYQPRGPVPIKINRS